MGWIKNLFRKKETEKQAINLSDISPWLNERTKQTRALLNKQLADILFEMKELVEKLKSEISVLENYEVDYKGHIENKVKSVVLGHRTNYIRLINQFIDSLDFPGEVNYKTANNFYTRTFDALNKFSAETVKTYYTVQHLFHKQVDDIAKTIKLFDKKLQSIKYLTEKNNIHLLEKAKNKINQLNLEIKKKEDIFKSIEEKKQKLSNSKQSRIDFTNRLEELKQGRDYLGLHNLKIDLNKIDNEINSLETELIQLFSPLEHALKKYQKITLEDEELIGRYIEKAHEALVLDKDFKIIHILLNLKNSVLSDSIELKEKKKEKTIETIDKIDKEVLDNFLAKRKEKLDNKKTIEEQINANKILDSVKEMEYKINHVTNLINKLKLDIEEKEGLFKNINIDAMRLELQDMLKKITDVDVTIS